MIVKVPDVKFGADGATPRGFRGHTSPPPEHSETHTEHSEMLFPAFLRQGWSSLKFYLKSKILNENGQ